MVTRNSSLPVRIVNSRRWHRFPPLPGLLLLCACSTSACACRCTSFSEPAWHDQDRLRLHPHGGHWTEGQTIIAATVVVGKAKSISQLPRGQHGPEDREASPKLTDIAVGDRALVTGKAGDTPDTLTAVRVIVMKSSDIAQMQQQQQADWKTRGTGGNCKRGRSGVGDDHADGGNKEDHDHDDEQDIVQAVCRRLSEVSGRKARQACRYPAERPVAGTRGEVRGRRVDAGRRDHQRLVRKICPVNF